MATAYKLLAGKHEQKENTDEGEKNVRYKEGDVVLSDRPLDKIFVNKFKRATGEEVKAARKAKLKEQEEARKAQEADEELERKLATTANARAEAEAEDEDEEEAEGEYALGQDVTDDFEGAEAAGLRVFKDGKKYNIAKEDSPDRAVRSGKELNKTEVRKYVKDHAPEEDEEEEEDVDAEEETQEDDEE